MRKLFGYLAAVATTAVFLLAGKLLADLLTGYVLAPRLEPQTAVLTYLTLHIALGWVACRIFYGIKSRLAQKTEG